MAKKIILIILIVYALPNFLSAQQKDSTTSLSRLLIVQATISPGYMFYNKGLWNSYFHCTLEWCFDRRVSIRADGFYFFSSQGSYQPLKKDHSLLLGAFYHFPKKKFDFYFGIQPGAAMVQQNPYTYNDSTISNPKLKITPVITGAIGVNYFFWKYMNMFLALKYIHGNHVSQYGKTIPLDELCISFGIGWHMRFRKTDSHIKVVGY
jgi:hypothetical protein